MTASSAVRYEQEIPDIFQAMNGVHAAMESHGLDRKLQHLVRLRASQINGCAFCIKMHIKDPLHGKAACSTSSAGRYTATGATTPGRGRKSTAATVWC